MIWFGFFEWNQLLTLEMTIFGTKMMVKIGLELFSYFEIEGALTELLPSSAKRIGPERLNWPDRFAGISEGACSIYKKSRPLLTVIFEPKMIISRVNPIIK